MTVPSFIVIVTPPVCTNILSFCFHGVALVDPVEQDAREAGFFHLFKGGIDNRTLDALKKGRNVAGSPLGRLGRILDCTPNEAVEIERE